MRRKSGDPKREIPRNYAFIDSQNLNLGTQKMGWKMDWAKFRQYLEKNYGVSKAYLFIGYMREHEDMYKQLHDQGYLIVLKPTVGMNEPDAPKTEESQVKKEGFQTFGEQAAEVLKPESGEATAEVAKKPPVKGNIDAELVLYAMKEIPNYEKAIIVSGDGDFYCLVEYLAEKKRLLHLMTPNWQYSSLLRPYEDYIIRLDQHRRELAYRNSRFKVKGRAA